jgi:predicted Rossmann-fold nucleotide-binding protein
LHTVDTMRQRKEQMIDLADAFIVLPGGVGTMEELFDVWSRARLGSSKPVGLLNTASYYDSLMVFARQMTIEGFLSETHLLLLNVNSNPQVLVETLLKLIISNNITIDQKMLISKEKVLSPMEKQQYCETVTTSLISAGIFGEKRPAGMALAN